MLLESYSKQIEEIVSEVDTMVVRHRVPFKYALSMLTSLRTGQLASSSGCH